MNKTLKYILLIIAGLFGIMLIAMLIMWTLPSNKVNKEMNSMSQTSKIKQRIGYKNISTNELTLMLKNKDFILVNVHIPYIGDIKGTDISIPFNKIKDNLDKLSKNKDAKIVLYCQSGRMSEIASEKLVELGYTNVFNLNGGMIEWKKQGHILLYK